MLSRRLAAISGHAAPLPTTYMSPHGNGSFLLSLSLSLSLTLSPVTARIGCHNFSYPFNTRTTFPVPQFVEPLAHPPLPGIIKKPTQHNKCLKRKGGPRVPVRHMKGAVPIKIHLTSDKEPRFPAHTRVTPDHFFPSRCAICAARAALLLRARAVPLAARAAACLPDHLVHPCRSPRPQHTQRDRHALNELRASVCPSENTMILIRTTTRTTPTNLIFCLYI